MCLGTKKVQCFYDMLFALNSLYVPQFGFSRRGRLRTRAGIVSSYHLCKTARRRDACVPSIPSIPLLSIYSSLAQTA